MHRSTRTVVTLAALVMATLPGVARAQGVHHSNDPFGGKVARPVPVSLARVVMENEKELALTDSQRVQVGLIRRSLDSSTAPLIAKLDSIRPTWRPAGGIEDLSPEQRTELVTYRNAHEAIIDSLVPRFEAARLRVLSVLNPEQTDRATKLEKNERKRVDELARHEFERQQMDAMRGQRRRGEIRDATGRAPLD